MNQKRKSNMRWYTIIFSLFGCCALLTQIYGVPSERLWTQISVLHSVETPQQNKIVLTTKSEPHELAKEGAQPAEVTPQDTENVLPLRSPESGTIKEESFLGGTILEDTQKVVPMKPSTDENTKEQTEIRKAFLHAWNGYKKFAWGHDELLPVSKRSRDNYCQQGLTIVDSLDTLLIMGLWEEYADAKEWVRTHLDFSRSTCLLSVFELTIRFVGGLLSAHYLSGDPLFLDKAQELGDLLMPAFHTKSTIPFGWANLATKEMTTIHWTNGKKVLSEAGSLQLEFTALSLLTGRKEYGEAVAKCMETLLKIPSSDGLWAPLLDDVHNENTGTISMGAYSDSFYEYLIKGYIQATAHEVHPVLSETYLKSYVKAVEGMEKHLMRRSHPGNQLFVGAVGDGRTWAFEARMEHLACFVPGMLALGVPHLDKVAAEHHLELGKEVGHTCYQMYNQSDNGLSPEEVAYQIEPGPGRDWRIKAREHHERPETMESLYVLFQRTQDKKYREWGWNIFQAWEKYTKIESGGYTGLRNVEDVNSYDDQQESFILAESFKYLYLLFDDNGFFHFDEWVFNTEAHPMSLNKDWNAEDAKQQLEERMELQPESS